jgi:hypothetical protein
MSSRSSGRTPSWGAVALEQGRMLLLLQRRDFLIVGLIGVGLVALGLWGLMQIPGEEAISRGSTMHVLEALGPLFVPLIPVGALWPLGVWRHDGPSQRGYFWSLPAARAPHTFLRVGLGWVLLMGVCLAAMLVSIGMAALFASRLPEAELSFAFWYLPLTAATLAYLLISVPVVLVDAPVRWVIWIVVALLGVRVVTAAVDMAALEAAVVGLARSLGTALAGPMTGEVPIGSWLTHYVGWFAAGLIGLTAGAFRHPDAG